jgi:hypothetical protein
MVRWLRHALHTGVYLATLRLPVGIVAWVYERRPRARGRLATDREPLLSLLWVGAVIGGLVLVVVITAGEAAATPAGTSTRAWDPLAAEEQSPHAATTATAAPVGTNHNPDDGRPQALTSASGQSRGDVLLGAVCAIAVSGLYTALPQQTQEISMTRTAVPSLTAEDWNDLYASGRVAPRLIGDGERRAAHSRLSLVRGMSAVDLGCGTGKWTRQLAAWGLDTIGLDFSQVALEQACAAVSRARYELWDIDNNATSSLLLPGSVDIVSCRLSFSFFDRSRLLPNVQRWLAPRGRLYILTDVADQHDGQLPPYECAMTEEEISSLGNDGWNVRNMFRLNRRAGIVLQPSGSPGP